MVTDVDRHLLRELPSDYVAQFVVDASVALKWIWPEEGSDGARSYAWRAVMGDTGFSAPSLFWYELANALRYGDTRNADPAHDPWRVLHAVPINIIDFRPEAFP